MVTTDRYLHGVDTYGRATASATTRAWLTPILLSLYFVPLPEIGARVVPFLLVFYLLTDLRMRFRPYDALAFVGLASATVVLIILDPAKFGFLVSLLLAILITRLINESQGNWNLIPVLWIHAGAVATSALTLIAFGYDLIPQLIYGESRHAVHDNVFLKFRVSGLYQEPSTLGLHMLLLSLWADQTHPRQRFVSMTFAGIALLTFSSITILAAFKIVMDLRKVLRSKFSLLLLPVVLVGGVVALRSFYLFFVEKVSLYAGQGLETAKRFEALFFTWDQIAFDEFNFFQGHDTDIIQKFVVYDLGPLLSTLLILGFPGALLVTAFLVRMRFSLVNIAIVLATKATLNNPLLWIATQRFTGSHSSGKWPSSGNVSS